LEEVAVDIKKDFRSGLIILLLASATVSSMILVARPAYSGGCISHPHGTIIQVGPGENFLLHYRLYWNEPGYDGTFGITLFWSNHENKPTENLTFLSARAYYDNQDNIPITVDLSSGPRGENTLWCLDIGNALAPGGPQPYDNNFSVDIWMRAAGVDNVPHIPTDNHPITGGGFKAVHVDEQFIEDIPGTEKPITIRVLRVPVWISPYRQDGLPGETLEYTVTITNMGGSVDNYSLSVTDTENWGPALSDNRIENLQPGENENVTLTITVPENAIGGTEDNITVTATGTQGENEGWCIAHVIGPGVRVLISPNFQENWAGGTLDYTVTVRNMGIAEDNYGLTVSDNENWGPTLLENRFENVLPNESRTTILHVTIPADAVHCTKGSITVTAISEANENIRDNNSCIAHALVFGVKVSISPSENKRVPGENLVYTVTVTNTGLKTDNYDLKVTDNASWGRELSKYKLENIENGKSENVTLTVTIPENASYGTRDNITVTATSQGDNTVENSASCIARSATVSLNIWITENYPTRVHGKTVTFTVNVKNTSEDPLFRDNYLLTVRDNENWGLNFGPGKDFLILSGILTGENGTATLYVTIPENAAYGTKDNVIVTATSVKNTRISAENSCIARSATVSLNIWITENYPTRVRGENATFTVNVKNTSEDPLFRDNYILTAKDNLGWQLWLKDNRIENVSKDNTRRATLTVTVPKDAAYGIEDNITVTAISMENENVKGNASCIARSATVSCYLWIDPNYSENLPGENITFRVWVANTSEDPLFRDNYRLENITDTLGWPLWLQDNYFENVVEMPRSIRLTVTVPENTANCTEDIVTVTAVSKFDNKVSKNANCIAHALTFKVGVSISPSENKRIQGKEANFTVTVTNNGLKTDNYTLKVSDNILPSWNPTLDNENFYNVPPKENRQTTLRVTIPPKENASYGTRDNITVTATSKGAQENENTTVENRASCIAQSATVSLTVSITPSENHRMHGENAIFTVKVTNTSDDPLFRDNYTLTAKDNLGWQLWLKDNYIENVGVGLANARTTTLTVTIPENASYCTRDNITVTATSKFDNTVSAKKSCTAHSAAVSVSIEVKPSYMVCVPKETATFTVTVTNTSDDPLFRDNYTLENTDNLGWSLSLSKNRIENLRSGESENVTLTATIPENENALEGRMDNIIVTATSQGDNTVSAENSCITRVGFVALEVSISPRDQRAFPNGKLIYDVWVKNTGTVVENFEFIELIDERGWISKTITLKTFSDVAPGENGHTTFTVTIPSDAAHGTNNNITIKWRAYHAYAAFKENVYPSDDAYVDKDEPSAPHNMNSLKIFADNRIPVTMSWLKFDLSLPSGAENIRLAGARLWLYCELHENVGLARNTEAYFSKNDDWFENTITYNNMPSFASTPTDSTLLIPGWQSWDVWNDARWEFEGDEKTSWCLKNEADWSNDIVSSRETANSPYLEITYENASKSSPAMGSCTAQATYIEVGLFISIPLPKLMEGRPGEHITFPVIITNINMENVADNYTLTVIDDAGWGPRLDNNFFENVPMGDGRETTLRVTVPENASAGTMDNLTVTATSQADNTISTSDYCHVLVTPFRRKVEVSITPTSQGNLRGLPLNYTVVVTNEGDVADSYTLTVSDNAGWSPSVSPSTLSIDAENTKYAALTVVIPEGAENGVTDRITVTATSGYDSSVRKSASCTAVASTVPPRHDVQVSISPEDQSGLPSEMLTYTITVKNTGEVGDTYDLSVSDTGGWGATLSENLLIIPENENRTASVIVIVPSGAVKDESTVITVVATSRADPSASDSDTCTAKVAEKPSEIPIPLIAGAAIGAGVVAAIVLLMKRRA